MTLICFCWSAAGISFVCLVALFFFCVSLYYYFLNPQYFVLCKMGFQVVWNLKYEFSNHHVACLKCLALNNITILQFQCYYLIFNLSRFFLARILFFMKFMLCYIDAAYYIIVILFKHILYTKHRRFPFMYLFN